MVCLLMPKYDNVITRRREQFCTLKSRETISIMVILKDFLQHVDKPHLVGAQKI